MRYMPSVLSAAKMQNVRTAGMSLMAPIEKAKTDADVVVLMDRPPTCKARQRIRQAGMLQALLGDPNY
jgi:hypothetical protein